MDIIKRGPLLLMLLLFAIACSSQNKYPVVRKEGNSVKIPVQDIKDAGIRFYTFVNDGNKIDFFARIDNGGNIHTHYDACYTCFKFRKGYAVDGQHIRCTECGTRFLISDEEWRDVSGCVPIRLPSTVTENYVEIKVEDLMRGRKLFN